MKVPLSWLHDYVDITLSTEELAERLTFAGLEIASIRYLGVEGAELPWDRQKIVVGQIVAVKRHPDADRLVLADVDYGGPEIETVVTGAPNLFDYLGMDTRDLNLKSPLAMEGVTLYDGHKSDGSLMTLKGRAIRGIMNRHMLCSEKELGISDSHEGILLLDPDAPVGMPLVDLLGTAVLDIDLTPNLVRCASIIGVAREVAALTGQTIRYPDWFDLPMQGQPIEELVIIETTEPELNPRFCAALIKDIHIGPSPFWVRLRLHLAGMRPINNVVDASNYVMLEMGQPTHAFDYDVLRARADQYTGVDKPVHIITRLAEDGEHVVTLDDVDRVMFPYTILVTDPGGALSIGGVMGGLESEVKEESTSILLEGANWNFFNLRRSVKVLNLNSEAAYRLSRGVHPELARVGVYRGIQLMQQLCGGTIAQGIIDYYPHPSDPVVIDLPESEISRILGIDVSLEQAKDILESLEFECQVVEGRILRATVPDHRVDISPGVIGQADLIEEIARIYGYDRIPSTQINDTMPPQRDNSQHIQEELMKDLLVGTGLQEVINYRLLDPEHESLLYVTAPHSEENRPYVTMVNPTSPERVSMRRTLVSGVLDVMANNARHRDRIWVFEIGPVFLPRPEAVENLPDECRRLAIGMMGPRRGFTWQASHEEAPAQASMADFFDLKGVVESFLQGLHVTEVVFEPIENPTYYPGRVAQLIVDGISMGCFGQIHPLVQEAFDLPSDKPVLVADIDLDSLSTHIPNAFLVRPLPRFPAIHQDIAVVVDDAVPANQVQETILEAGGRLLVEARLFDVYRGEQVGAGKKSLAYTLTFYSDERTLTDKQVAKVQATIVKTLKARLGASLRQ